MNKKTTLLILVFLIAIIFINGCEEIYKEENKTKENPIECQEDSDCVPETCCHPTNCVEKEKAPNCTSVYCTMECKPGTMDCGGKCICSNGNCNAEITSFE